MPKEDSSRKPHNHFDELTPAQKEEHNKIEAAAAEAKRIKEIGDAQRTFNIKNLERFKLELKKPEIRSRLRSKKPFPEEVAIARGLIKIHPPIRKVKGEVDH